MAELGLLVMMVGLLAVAGAPDFLGMHRGPVPGPQQMSTVAPSATGPRASTPQQQAAALREMGEAVEGRPPSP